jgi:hypothetical protein
MCDGIGYISGALAGSGDENTINVGFIRTKETLLIKEPVVS